MRRHSVPFVGLGRREWEYLADAAALLALVLVVLGSSYAVFQLHQQDFRGYYAAAYVALHGGDPYDYAQVAAALIEITGVAGNNPFYYPPWFCVAMLPFAALFPYEVARGVWIIVNWAAMLGGLALAFRAIGWPVRGWRCWLTWLLAFYLFGWVTLKFEQLGMLMWLCLAWALWAIRAERDLACGIAMALLLTKPNVTVLAFVALAFYLARRRRRALVYVLVALVALTVVGTALFPGWIWQIGTPDFGVGLTRLTDGPGRVIEQRRLCTLLYWLEALGVTGWPAYGVYALLAAVAAWWVSRSARLLSDPVFAAALGVCLMLLLTPYALLYDYTPLVVGLIWTFRRWSSLSKGPRWLVVAVLLFMGGVLLWAGPEYDGYWLALGMAVLLAAGDLGGSVGMGVAATAPSIRETGKRIEGCQSSA